MFDTVLFDLDGTLTNPFEGITNSIIYALDKFGVEVADRNSLSPFIGPPLVNSFKSVYGFSQADADRAVAFYREFFAEKGIFQNEVYDGVHGLLKELKERGKKIVLATSKPDVFAVRIVAHFGLDRYLSHIAGATLDGTRGEKGDVIAHAIKIARITDLDGAIMVGDRKYDALGARENGLKCIGVTYGFGSRQELEDAKADFIVDCPRDILEIIR